MRIQPPPESGSARTPSTSKLASRPFATLVLVPRSPKRHSDLPTDKLSVNPNVRATATAVGTTTSMSSSKCDADSDFSKTTSMSSRYAGGASSTLGSNWEKAVAAQRGRRQHPMLHNSLTSMAWKTMKVKANAASARGSPGLVPLSGKTELVPPETWREVHRNKSRSILVQGRLTPYASKRVRWRRTRG